MMRANLLFLTLVALGCARTTNLPQVTGGWIDLTQYDFTSHGVLALKGEWDFFPGKILTPDEIKKSVTPTKFAYLPQSFNSYQNPELRLPAAAAATYRVRLKLPNHAAQYEFRIPPPATASRVFLNGILRAETGFATEDLEQTVAKNRVRYVEATLGGEVELIVQVSNLKNRKGGVWQPVTFGREEALSKERLVARFLDVAVSAALVTFALYHLINVLIGNPEVSLLFFSLFCMLVGVRRLFTGEQLIAEMLPHLSWEAHITIEYITFYGAAASFIMFVRRFFAELRPQKSLKIFAGISTAFVVLVMILPVELSRSLLQPFQAFFFGVCVFTFYKILKLARRGVFGAMVFLSGFIVLIGAFCHDMLVNAEVLTTPPLITYAIVVFIFMQAFLITGKSIQLFRENNQLSKRLLESDRLRDDFLTHTSHDLRTPLQAIVQIVENLRRGVSGAVSEQVQRVLSAAEENGRRLIYILDDLADFVRLKHGDIRLNIEAVSLKKIVSPVLQLCLGLAGTKNLVLADEIPADLDDIEIDPVRFQQVLMNLLNVAIRQSHSQLIVVKTRQIENKLAVSIVYQGIEPDSRFQDKEEAISNEDAGGRVTKRLAELMGGSFVYQKHAESQHSLNITLPYANMADLAQKLSQNRARVEYRKNEDVSVSDFPARMTEAAARGSNLLIISDSPSQSRLLQEQLMAIDRKITVARSGSEAMLHLQNDADIALIICDVLLPDVSGIELAMNIRVHYDIGLLPIIMLIENNQTGIAASAFSAGVNDLIRRPLERAEVLARVKNVLLQREASLARENYRALSRELEIARSIQESILPTSQPKSDNYKIEAVCLPARSIGGDFYDFVEDKDYVAVLIADVAGHGIPAALYASMLKIAFHNLRSQARYPEMLLKELNNVMIDRGERTFISCAYTILDFKNRRLLHANAGHLPLLIQEPGSTTVKKIHPPGGVLGIRKAASVTVEMMHLLPKTRLVLFTDGVIELTNRKGEFFEEERLIKHLEATRQLPISEVKDQLLAAMRQFSEGEVFLDDVTFIVLET